MNNLLLNSKNKIEKAIIMIAIILVMGILVFVSFNWLIAITGQDAVNFEDRSLEKAIKEYLNDAHITKKDAQKVYKIEIKNHPEITNIEDLRLFPNLEELSITDCNIENLQGLETLNKLTKVNLEANNIEKIDILYNNEYKNLRYLKLDNNPLRYIPREIFDLNELKEISMQYCMLNGIIDLGDIKNLEVLTLDNNSITGISITSNSIQKLSLNNNCISDIFHLGSISSLKELKLAGNPLTSLNGISAIQNLEVLDLRRTDVQNVDELIKVKTLNSLYVSENFDRTKIDFLESNFKNGDIYTKKYILAKRHSLK